VSDEEKGSLCAVSFPVEMSTHCQNFHLMGEDEIKLKTQGELQADVKPKLGVYKTYGYFIFVLSLISNWDKLFKKW